MLLLGVGVDLLTTFFFFSLNLRSSWFLVWWMIFDRNQDIFTCPETLNLMQTGFSWFVLIPFQQGMKGWGEVPCYCQVEVVVMVPTWALLTPGGGGPSLASSRGMLGTSSQSLEGESLGSLLSLCLCKWKCAHIFFPSWYLARVGWLVSESFFVC